MELARTSTPAPRPSAPADRYGVGTVIATKYRLEKQIGEGGMGTVWLARNIALDLPVALKLILPQVEPSAELIHRLLIEARVEATLQHTGIVRVFDFGETDDGLPYLVMELLTGRSLADVLADRSKLDAKLTVRALLPVLDALAHAHDRGIVHRDLKPENIFMTRTEHGTVPKVLDFGIAKLMNSEIGKATQRGVVLGSPAYMAPEQAYGLDDVDARADVFAISAVIYECVSGRRAFKGSNYNSILRAVIEDQVEPLTEASELTSTLWPVLRRGLIKDRNARFQSMRELGSALASWLLAQGVTEDISGMPLVHRWQITVVDPNAPEYAITARTSPQKQDVRSKSAAEPARKTEPSDRIPSLTGASITLAGRTKPSALRLALGFAVAAVLANLIGSDNAGERASLPQPLQAQPPTAADIPPEPENVPVDLGLEKLTLDESLTQGPQPMALPLTFDAPPPQDMTPIEHPAASRKAARANTGAQDDALATSLDLKDPY